MIRYFAKKYLKKCVNSMISDIDKNKMQQSIATIDVWVDRVKKIYVILDHVKTAIKDGTITDAEIDDLETQLQDAIKDF